MTVLVLVCNADGTQTLVEREIVIPQPPEGLPEV